VTNGIPLGCPRFLPVHTVNCVQTLKATSDKEAIQNLGALASTVDTTFVSFTNQLITDIAGNAVVAIGQNNAAQTKVLGTVQRAAVENWELDMSAATLKITFSASVAAIELKAQYITVQATQTSTSTSYTLTSDTTTADGDGFSLARCAFFDRDLHSRSAIGSHAIAPHEALPCV
jgi:hypothetical protein